jgi:hypothetical protein
MERGGGVVIMMIVIIRIRMVRKRDGGELGLRRRDDPAGRRCSSWGRVGALQIRP